MWHLRHNSLAFLDGIEHPDHVKDDEVAQTDDWHLHDSSFQDYCNLSGLAGVEATILTRLSTLPSRSVLDLAGGTNAQALQYLLRLGVAEKGLVTTYLDRRSDTVKTVDTIPYVFGDLLDRKTWRKIINWKKRQTPEGFGLVMHRPVGALQHLPPNFYQGAANFLLDNIRPRGMLLAQIPKGLEDDATAAAIHDNLIAREDVASIQIPVIHPYSSCVLITKQPIHI